MTINRESDELAIEGESTADLWSIIKLMYKCTRTLCAEDENFFVVDQEFVMFMHP